MKSLNNKVLSMLMWTWGGTVYFFMEVFWKTFVSNKPEQISWTMLLLAVFLCIPVERCGDELPWECPLWLQSLVCSSVVLVVEFLAGIVLNIWLQLNIWDYSNLKFNILGQVCPQFFGIWFVLCFIFIPVFDWIRWSIQGGEKPHYRLFK